VREDGQRHEQRGRVRSPCAPRYFVDCKGDAGPNECSDEAVRERHVVRVEHTSCRETPDHAKFFNTEQNENRSDVIEKLDGNEQHPERDFVLLRFNRKRDAVMSNEHFWLKET
jgi:hypothetical protein